MNEAEYIAQLIGAFSDLHGCEATYLETAPVRERRDGGDAWDGLVDIFELKGDPGLRLALGGRGQAAGHYGTGIAADRFAGNGRASSAGIRDPVRLRIG